MESLREVMNLGLLYEMIGLPSAEFNFKVLRCAEF